MRRRPLRALGAVVAVAILVATALATAAAVRHAEAHDERARSEAAVPAVRALAEGLSRSTEGVEYLRAFFESSDEVTALDYERFASGPLAREPSLLRLSWDPLDAAAPAYTAARPGAPAARPPDADELRARDEARDTAEPRVVGPSETGDEPPLLRVLSAVYAPGSRIATVAERRAALRGFASTVTDADVLVHSAGTVLPSGARLTVREGDRLIAGAPGARGVDGEVDVAGRRWSVGVAGVEGGWGALPWAVAIAGVALAILVWGLMHEAGGRLRRVRDTLARLRDRQDLILAAVGDGILGIDPRGRVAFANEAAAQTLGWPAEELTGHLLPESIPGVLDRPEGGEERPVEVTMRRRDGATFPGEYTITPIAEDGVAMGAVVAFRDVTARRRREDRTLRSLAAAEERAAVDPLTGLANHRTFHDRLRVEVERARRHRRSLALVLMDLDHFKRVNDRYGHQVGDRVLQHAARLLEGQTRSGELVARVGGEEFAMILPEADERAALRAAERIRMAMSASVFPAVGTMTISAGVCDLAGGPDAEALYRLADGALYRAKRAGRDIVVGHDLDDPPAAPAPERPAD